MHMIPFNIVEWSGAIMVICLLAVAALGGTFTLLDAANQIWRRFDPAERQAKALRAEAARKAKMLAEIRAEMSSRDTDPDIAKSSSA
jgi:hypothetical protein